MLFWKLAAGTWTQICRHFVGTFCRHFRSRYPEEEGLREFNRRFAGLKRSKILGASGK